MKDYLSKWNYKRLIQFGLGLFFLYYYVQDHSNFALALGIIMLLQALFNVGCFSTKGCHTSTNDVDDKEDFAKQIKEIDKE